MYLCMCVCLCMCLLVRCWTCFCLKIGHLEQISCCKLLKLYYVKLHKLKCFNRDKKFTQHFSITYLKLVYSFAIFFKYHKIVFREYSKTLLIQKVIGKINLKEIFQIYWYNNNTNNNIWNTCFNCFEFLLSREQIAGFLGNFGQKVY